MKGLNQRPVLNHDAKVAAAVHTLAVLLLKAGQSNAIEWLRPLCDDQQEANFGWKHKLRAFSASQEAANGQVEQLYRLVLIIFWRTIHVFKQNKVTFKLLHSPTIDWSITKRRAQLQYN